MDVLIAAPPQPCLDGYRGDQLLIKAEHNTETNTHKEASKITKPFLLNETILVLSLTKK